VQASRGDIQEAGVAWGRAAGGRLSCEDVQQAGRLPRGDVQEAARAGIAWGSAGGGRRGRRLGKCEGAGPARRSRGAVAWMLRRRAGGLLDEEADWGRSEARRRERRREEAKQPRGEWGKAARVSTVSCSLLYQRWPGING
jgi:hypothetical protein